MWSIIYVWVTFEDTVSYLVLFTTCLLSRHYCPVSADVRRLRSSRRLSTWHDKQKSCGPCLWTLVLIIKSRCLSSEIDLEMYTGHGGVCSRGEFCLWKHNRIFSVWRKHQMMTKARGTRARTWYEGHIWKIRLQSSCGWPSVLTREVGVLFSWNGGAAESLEQERGQLSTIKCRGKEVIVLEGKMRDSDYCLDTVSVTRTGNVRRGLQEEAKT